jgi:hypothetical protein
MVTAGSAKAGESFFPGQRERGREREREKERGRERERKKEGGRERERGRDVEYGYRIYFIAFNNGRFYKGMTGALAPFSYLVKYISQQRTQSLQ